MTWGCEREKTKKCFTCTSGSYRTFIALTKQALEDKPENNIHDRKCLRDSEKGKQNTGDADGHAYHN